MVLVAAGGVHDQEHHQENDHDDSNHASLGHAAVHFDQGNVRNFKSVSTLLRAINSNAVRNAWVLTRPLSNGKIKCGGDGGTVDVDRPNLHFIG